MYINIKYKIYIYNKYNICIYIYMYIHSFASQGFSLQFLGWSWNLDLIPRHTLRWWVW